MFFLIMNDSMLLFMSFLLFFFIYMLFIYKYTLSSILNDFISVVYFFCPSILFVRLICSFLSSAIFNITFWL